MSNRYNIYLRNKTTGKEHYHQLFGNNEWYDTFAKYFQSIGANTEDEWIDKIKVPDLLELVKAIDETVWTDIIFNGPIPKNETYNPYEETKMYSPYLDFTPNLIMYDNDTEDLVVPFPMYQIASELARESYFFTSYNFINWLEKNDAIENTRIQFTKHSYMPEKSFREEGEPIIIGDLKPEFELYISWG